MSSFEASCILIPVSSLEDFPSTYADPEARSLLAAWTVLWHPKLIARSEQLPTWYRADGPPDLSDLHRVIAVPTSSFSMLPEGFEQKCRTQQQIQWASGASRHEFLEQLGLVAADDSSHSLAADLTPQAERRGIAVEDFFALGYAMLQVQVMTRRLRYTSNLDEIYFQSRVVDAAKAFQSGDAAASVAAMHDAFDCLAQERDHYFSSDPHLLDLTLLSESTIDAFFSGLQATVETDFNHESKLPGLLVTPRNVLIDSAIAARLDAGNPANLEQLRQLFDNKTLGWAGGGLPGNVCLDTMTFVEAEHRIADAFEQTGRVIGVRPSVYARFSGTTPSDLTKVIASLDVAGMISIDFENGCGFGEEAKVIQKSGGVELQALTAKPIDASSETPFLNLGAKLGEAIDSGEIATALLVHWPGHVSDSYQDLRRVASWSLVLGRAWTLEDFFRTGEQPYHHDSTKVANSRADLTLSASVQRNEVDPISSVVEQTQRAVTAQSEANLRAMIALASGKISCGEGVSDEDQMARAVGLESVSGDAAVCLLNPTPGPIRSPVSIVGNPLHEKHVYAASGHGKQSIVTTDVPALGFSVIRNQSSGKSSGRSIGQRIRDCWLGTGKLIVADESLQNAFTEVKIDSISGGIKGAYSGATRGNRLSMRLVCVTADPAKGKRDSDASDCSMQCDKLKVLANRSDRGEIQTNGRLLDAEANKVGEFALRYSLERGSRLLRVDGELDLQTSLGEDPWKQYFAVRTAIANDAMVPQSLLRDKLHRVSSRRIVAPLGVLLDEADRQTLVASAGLAYHRRVGDRFLDTLLSVRGETGKSFCFYYGFDVPSPILAARGVLTQPLRVSVKLPKKSAGLSRGWLVHLAPSSVLIADISLLQDEQQRLLAVVRLIQTRAQGCKASLRFCRTVTAAAKLTSGNREEIAALHDALNSQEPKTKLQFDDDRVRIPMTSHEVVDLVVALET